MKDSRFQSFRYAQKETLVVLTFLVLECLTLAHFVHEAWYANLQTMKLHPPQPGSPMSTYFIFQNPTLPLHAPEAYRVALPSLGRFLMRFFRVTDASKVAAGLDFVFALFTLILLYRLAVGAVTTAERLSPARVTKIALLFAFIQFPIHWVVPWQRPETLPTALFLALSLFCLSRCVRHLGWSILLVGAAILQSFVRSDVPCVLGAALCILSVSGSSLHQFGSRRANFIRGTALAAVALGIQAYLQFVRLPHLSYWPDTPIIAFHLNFQLHNLSNALLALFPFLVVVSLAYLNEVKLDSVSLVTLVASGLFLPVWFTVGIVDEVRVYVPFLFALSLVATKVVANLVENLPEGPEAHQTT